MTTAAPPKPAPTNRRRSRSGKPRPKPLRLVPCEDLDTVELSRAAPTGVAPQGVGSSCPECGTPVAEGSIVDGEVSYEKVGVGAPRVPSVIRRFYCAHCRGLVTWVESLDRVTGKPSGHVLMGPGLIYDRKAIEAFLTDHPHATNGVTDAGRP